MATQRPRTGASIHTGALRSAAGWTTSPAPKTTQTAEMIHYGGVGRPEKVTGA